MSALINSEAELTENGDIGIELFRFPGQRSTPRPATPRPTNHDNFLEPEDALPDDAENGERGESESSERARVIRALEQSGWVQAKAARLLNMTPRQIAYRILTLRIEVKQF